MLNLTFFVQSYPPCHPVRSQIVPLIQDQVGFLATTKITLILWCCPQLRRNRGLIWVRSICSVPLWALDRSTVRKCESILYQNLYRNWIPLGLCALPLITLWCICSTAAIRIPWQLHFVVSADYLRPSALQLFLVSFMTYSSCNLLPGMYVLLLLLFHISLSFVYIFFHWCATHIIICCCLHLCIFNQESEYGTLQLLTSDSRYSYSLVCSIQLVAYFGL